MFCSFVSELCSFVSELASALFHAICTAVLLRVGLRIKVPSARKKWCAKDVCDAHERRGCDDTFKIMLDEATTRDAKLRTLKPLINVCVTLLSVFVKFKKTYFRMTNVSNCKHRATAQNSSVQCATRLKHKKRRIVEFFVLPFDKSQKQRFKWGQRWSKRKPFEFFSVRNHEVSRNIILRGNPLRKCFGKRLRHLSFLFLFCFSTFFSGVGA